MIVDGRTKNIGFVHATTIPTRCGGPEKGIVWTGKEEGEEEITIDAGKWAVAMTEKIWRAGTGGIKTEGIHGKWKSDTRVAELERGERGLEERGDVSLSDELNVM
jgi:hypothetical protein